MWVIQSAVTLQWSCKAVKPLLDRDPEGHSEQTPADLPGKGGPTGWTCCCCSAVSPITL